MRLKTVLNAIVAAVFCLSLSVPSFAATELKHWPAEAKAKIEEMIKKNANKGKYATFDMDQTTYRYDLMDPLLAYMDQKGVLTRDTMDPSLKLIPFKDIDGKKESMSSYYWRLCEIDDLVCYPWVSQVFAGITLRDLKTNLDEMLALKDPIKVSYVSGDKIKETTLAIPKMFRGMQELYAKLRENGIEVYIMTAGLEELIRMVASDPQYGYNIKPENVIGVTTLLKDTKTGELTTSRLQISKGTYNYEKNKDLMLTAFLMNPMTWFEGKQGSTIGYINQWQRPIIAGGDSTGSDTFMLESVDVEKGGVKLWVNRKDEGMNNKKAKWAMDHAKKSAEQQAKLGLPVTADKNWIVVNPSDIQ